MSFEVSKIREKREKSNKKVLFFIAAVVFCMRDSHETKAFLPFQAIMHIFPGVGIRG